MEIQSTQIAKSNIDRWTLHKGEYEIVPERGVVRLLKYKKTFSDDIVVKRDGVPLLLKGTGRPLMANEVLRERADLALDIDGNLLSQGDFNSRYEEWLGAFSYPEGHEIGLDPVPNVAAYVSEEQDKYSESAGFIEIGYPDPADQEKHALNPQYDTEGRTQADRDADSQSDFSKLMVQALVDKLTPEQAAEMLESNNVDIPVVGEGTKEIIEVESQAFTAPCGQACKSNAGLSAHVRHCKNESCCADGEAA